MKAANNGTYAIPTNTAIGEYTYLLLNKEALDDFDYDTDAGLGQFTGITSETAQDFLADVQAYKLSGDEKTDKYTHALYSELDEIALASSGIYYWGIDDEGNLTNSFSALASNINSGAAYGNSKSYMENITSVLDTKFADQLKIVKGYQSNGYYGTEDEFKAGKVAMACVTGGAEIPSQYAEHYEAVVIGTPTLNTMDLYENLFAVSSYTANTSRSMEILTYLNTNEDLRNLLQYGIVEEDYRLVDSKYTDEEGNPYKVVELLKNDDGGYDYVMDINKTGNTLIAYCTEDQNPAIRDFIKEQNIDSVASITMGYRLDYKDLNVDMDALNEVKALSATVLAELKACDYASYDAKVSELRDMLNEEDCFYALAADEEPAEDESLVGLTYSYTEWAVEKKLYTRPTEETE